MDYFIVNEFSRNWDGFKKSRRLHKDENSNDSLLHAGPVWDFDWAFKDHSSDMLNGSGWMHSFAGLTDVTPPGWYIRLIQDPYFAQELSCRYFNLRQTILHKDTLFQMIDSIGAYVNEAQARHYERWPILGQNVGTPEIGPQPTTYAGELIKLKGWISDRIEWLDANMPSSCPNVGLENPNKLPYFVMYPNPTNGELTIYVDEPIETFTVLDISGKHIKSFNTDGTQSFILPEEFTPGLYVVHIQLANNKVIQSKFSVF